MPKMVYCTLFACTHTADTPLKEVVEILNRTVRIGLPTSLNEILKLGKKLLNRIQIRRVWWQIY